MSNCKKITIENALECMMQFEEENHLFDTLECNGEKSWLFFRFPFWNAIIENLVDAKNLNSSIETIYKKVGFFEKINQAITKNPLLTHKVDILAFAVGRRIKFGDYYKDVYYDNWLNKYSGSWYMFENEYAGIHFQPALTRHLKYFSVEKYANLMKIKKVAENIDTKQLVKIISDFEIYSGLVFDKQQKNKMLRTYADIFKYRNFYLSVYRKVLKQISPKIIFLVCYYSFQNMFLIEAAKELGIKTVEIDHAGLVNHFAYNFINKHDLCQFPDYIFAFGKFEVDYTKFPLDKKFIIPIGSAELEKAKQHYKKELSFRKKKKKIITFISTAITEKYLSECAYYLSELLNDEYTIYFKLHPSEYRRWEHLYPMLKNSTVIVCDDSKNNIYYYLAVSDYIVGTGSNAVFEATVFSGTILILKEKTYWHLQTLIDRGDALLVENAQDIFRIVSSGKKNKITNADYYFSNKPLDNILQSITKIIG